MSLEYQWFPRGEPHHVALMISGGPHTTGSTGLVVSMQCELRAVSQALLTLIGGVLGFYSGVAALHYPLYHPSSKSGVLCTYVVTCTSMNHAH